MDGADAGAIQVLDMTGQLRAAHDCFANPPSHLGCCRVRERDRHELIDLVILKQADVALDEDSRFAAARARRHDDIATAHRDGLFLFRRQIHDLCRLKAFTRQMCFMAQYEGHSVGVGLTRKSPDSTASRFS